MKAFKFLIPVAAAAAALSGQVQATAHNTQENASEKTSFVPTASLGDAIANFYVKDGERHSLMMKTSVSGQMLAYHGSHSSHSSHSSHYSHQSGR